MASFLDTPNAGEILCGNRKISIRHVGDIGFRTSNAITRREMKPLTPVTLLTDPWFLLVFRDRSHIVGNLCWENTAMVDPSLLRGQGHADSASPVKGHATLAVGGY